MEDTLDARALGAPATLVAQITDSEGTKEVKIKGKEEQTLFIKNTPYDDFPHIYDGEGAEFVVTFVRDQVIGEATKQVAEFAKKANMKLALTRLEKGFLIANNGDIIHNITKAGKQHRVIKDVIYTNEGVCMEVLKRRAAGGTTKKGVDYSTKGIDQIKAMSEYGVKAKGWKLLSKTGSILDIFDIAQALLDFGNGTGSFASLPGVTPMTAVIGAIASLGDMHWNKLDQEINEVRVRQIERAKKQGLKSLEKVVDADNNCNRGKEKIGAVLDNGQFTYYLVEVSKEIASKLLAGEFRTIESLRPYFSNKAEVTILFKKIGHPEFMRNIFVVETFYIL